MSDTSDARSQQTVPVWNLFKNPIFRRYSRSRLRAKALIPWLLVVGVVTTFMFLLIWVGGTSNSSNVDRQFIARIILLVLIPIQAFLLMLIGTGAVASGIMLEGSDGGIEYQRLTPLKPLTKIIGYVFGLPVREYCLFLVTVPFMLIAISIGSVPLHLVFSLYVAFFTSVLLYHLSGCVAGMVVNRRFAGRIAQMMVVVLYLVLPQIAKLGFEFFSYLTILPVLSEVIGALIPEVRLVFDQAFGTGARSVSLFGMEVEALPFSLIIQGSLIVTFVVVLYRKWRQPTHHMLGKNLAAFLCLWIHILLLGSTVPLIDSGEIFPEQIGRKNDAMAREIARELGQPVGRPLRVRRGEQNPTHAYWLSASYGVGALVLSCGLIMIITPTRDEFTKGLRRARKLGRRRVKPNADGATAVYHAAAIALIGAAAWAVFSVEMFESHWFTTEKMGGRAPIFSSDALRVVPFSQILFVLALWAVLEWGERRALLFFVLFAWIVPVMAGLILLIKDNDGLHQVASLMGSVSAFPSPFFALSFPIDHQAPHMGFMSNSFIISVIVYLVVVIYFISKVRTKQRSITQRVEEGGDAPPAASREIAP